MNKKSPQADLENKKHIFFQIGLVVAISLVFLVLETGVKLSKKEKANHYSEIELTIIQKSKNNSFEKVISSTENCKLSNFIQKELKIPKEVKNKNIKGIIYVNEKNKTISINFLNKVHPILEKEVIRVANKIPTELLISDNTTKLKQKKIIPFVFK